MKKIKKDMALAARIKQARTSKGLSQSALARLLGVSRGAVGQWETAVTAPSGENLRQIAIETDVSHDWLSTARGDPAGYNEPFRGYVLQELGLPFAGEVEAGAFRSVNLADQRGRRILPVPPDPRYSRVRQWAWEVRGDSMDKAGIEDGMIVTGALYGDFVEYYGDISNPSLVIVRRTRAQEMELTVKEARSFPDRLELHPKSTNSNHSVIVIPRSRVADDAEIQIIAVVFGAHRVFAP